MSRYIYWCMLWYIRHHEVISDKLKTFETMICSLCWASCDMRFWMQRIALRHMEIWENPFTKIGWSVSQYLGLWRGRLSRVTLCHYAPTMLDSETKITKWRISFNSAGVMASLFGTVFGACEMLSPRIRYDKVYHQDHYIKFIRKIAATSVWLYKYSKIYT